MIFLLALVVVAAVVLFLALTYKVIDPNEAHVVVFMGRGRKVYTPKEGGKTSYFFIPHFMKRFMLPLTNVKMDIQNIHLHDKEVAPFVCDVITWLHISDPIQAAERLNLANPFPSLQADLENIVQAVARAVAMKQEVIDILRDRATFSQSVNAEVGKVLDAWGIQLINLEVNEIRDDSERNSHVIENYEKQRQVQVESTTRKEIAERNREAVEVEQDNIQKSEIAKAVSEEAFRKKQIEKDQNIGLAEQEQRLTIASAQEKTNQQQVSSERALTVGLATVSKEAAIEKATGEAEAIRITGEKQADVKKLTGAAEASAIEATGLAQAVAKEKMAEALAKFNDAGIDLEKVRAAVQIEIAKYEALGKALSSADLKLVSSGEGGNIFGFPLNASTGADLGKMVEAFGGMDKIKSVISSVKSAVSPSQS